MRERSAGSTYGTQCVAKGASDEWVARRLVEKLDGWGLKDFQVCVKAYGEPAIRKLQDAIRQLRPAPLHLRNAPVRDPQANGVAERAVREYPGLV